MKFINKVQKSWLGPWIGNISKIVVWYTACSFQSQGLTTSSITAWHSVTMDDYNECVIYMDVLRERWPVSVTNWRSRGALAVLWLYFWAVTWSGCPSTVRQKTWLRSWDQPGYSSFRLRACFRSQGPNVTGRHSVVCTAELSAAEWPEFVPDKSALLRETRPGITYSVSRCSCDPRVSVKLICHWGSMTARDTQVSTLIWAAL